MNSNKNETVLVGLSGGVDSAVCATLLKNAGFNVIGATMSIWDESKNHLKTGHKNACLDPHEKEDIETAGKIAKMLNIPYYVFDLKEKYEQIVLSNFKDEYLAGCTPNPCVWCNSLIKFKALLEAAKSEGVKFDKFATGHYAQITSDSNGYHLKRGAAPNKDQSYFLYRLKKEQLKDIIFPLGGLTKDQTREIAKNAGLEVAQKRDSQDFYSGDYNELLDVQDKLGNIVDLDGKILGTHKGIWNYTVGQRKGLCVPSNEPLYVLSLRKDTNEVVVGNVDKTFKKTVIVSKLNLLENYDFENGVKVQAKIRSAMQPANAFIKYLDDSKEKIILTFDDYQKSIAKGQSAVFYDSELVLGGGIIEEAK